LVGLAGIEHGIFEVLQGNVTPEGPMIEAIGPGQRFWEYGTETALTVVPSIFLSGILAICIGILVTVWAGAFVEKRHGTSILVLLSVTLWLVGGGFAPIFMTILAGLAGTRINRPVGWRGHLGGLRVFLSRLWPASMTAFVLVFVAGVEIAIFGYPLLWILDSDATYGVQLFLALIMVVLMLVAVLSALAHDAQKSGE
jgi:hypothetical protein